MFDTSKNKLARSDFRITPPALQGCIILIRFVRSDQTYDDRFPHTRDYELVRLRAIAFLHSFREEYYKVQILGLDPHKSKDALTAPVYEALVSEIMPFYVRWESPDFGEVTVKRFRTRTAAYNLYSDLQCQDYLVLETNSIPVRRGRK